MTENGAGLMMEAVLGFTISGILGLSFLDVLKEFNILQWIIYISSVLGALIYGINYLIRFMKHIDRIDSQSNKKENKK